MSAGVCETMKTYKYLGIAVLLCVIGMAGIMAFGFARGDKSKGLPKVDVKSVFGRLDEVKENERKYYKTDKGIYFSEYNGVSSEPYSVCFKANGTNKWTVIKVNGNTPIESVLNKR